MKLSIRFFFQLPIDISSSFQLFFVSERSKNLNPLKKDRFSFGLFQGFSPEKNVDQKLSKVDVFVSEPQFFNDFNQFGRKKKQPRHKNGCLA